MRYLILILGVLILNGCEDRYRYFCQNPDNFGAPQCQKPACEFNQTCPEYLVTPILGAKNNAPAYVAPPVQTVQMASWTPPPAPTNPPHYLEPDEDREAIAAARQSVKE